MSIAILDVTSKRISTEFLPTEPIILIICSPNCLIPNTIPYKQISRINLENLLLDGIYCIRASNNCERGVIIGSLCSKHGLLYNNIKISIKIFTSRSNIIFKCIEITPEALSIPIYNWPINIDSGSDLNSYLDSKDLFDILYMESLVKYSKTFLCDKLLRAYKEKSAKAQLKNIVEGTIASNKKKGKNISIEADEIVDAIFSDFELNEIIYIKGNIEYNDINIDAYFGVLKTKTFIPTHKAIKPQVPLYPIPVNYRSNLLYQSTPLEISHQFITTNDIQLSQAQESYTGDYIKSINKSYIESYSETSLEQSIEPSTLETDIHTIIDYAIEKIVPKLNSISNILVLFRETRQILQEFGDFESMNINYHDNKHIFTSCIKIFLDLFFIVQSNLTNEEIVKDLFKHGKVVLQKRD